MKKGEWKVGSREWKEERMRERIVWDDNSSGFCFAL